MDNCQENKKMIPTVLWEALIKLPAFRYLKAPVQTKTDLYIKYPIGNENGSFAFVFDDNIFYVYQGFFKGWKPISGGALESLFEIDTDLLKEGDVLVYDNTQKKFVIKSGNVWNKLIDTVSSFIQTSKFINEVEEIPTYENDPGIYFVHKDNGEILFRALYIVLGNKAIKIFSNSDYYTKESIESMLEDERYYVDAQIQRLEELMTNLGIRKTYPTYDAMQTDVNNPVGDDGEVIRVGELVMVVNMDDPSKDGVYRYKVVNNVKSWEYASGIGVVGEINKKLDKGSYEGTADDLAVKGGSNLTMQQMDDKKADLSFLEIDVVFSAQSGQYINSSGVLVGAASTYFATTPKYDCREDEEFIVRNYINSVPHGLVVFYADDTDASFISGLYAGGSGNITAESRVTAPTGASKVRFGYSTVNGANPTFKKIFNPDQVADQLNTLENEFDAYTANNADAILPNNNILSIDTVVVANSVLQYPTGNVVALTGGKYTETYIPVLPNSVYNYQGYIWGWIAIVIYDKAGNVLLILSQNGTPDLIGDGRNFNLTTPEKAAYIRLSSATSTMRLNYIGESLYTKTTELFNRVMDNAIDINQIDKIIDLDKKLIVPSIIYSTVGIQHSIYLENITDNNPGVKVFATASSNKVTVTNKRMTINTDAVGDIIINIRLVSPSGELIDNRNIIIRTVINTLNVSPVVVCIGDSLTELHNLAYHWQEALRTQLTPGSVLPIFAGTKGGEETTYDKLHAYHEGYYGTGSGRFTSLNANNPFYNEATNQIDIANYLTKAKYYDTNGVVQTGISTVDVVPFLIGFNDTNEASKQTTLVTANNILTVIGYFKAFNPNCKFIVNLVPLTALDAPSRYYKNPNLLTLRQSVIDMFTGMENVFIGDMGFCVDRFNGYNGQIENASSFYPGKSFDMRYPVYNDSTHPTTAGTQEIVSNNTGVLLAAIGG